MKNLSNRVFWLWNLCINKVINLEKIKNFLATIKSYSILFNQHCLDIDPCFPNPCLHNSVCVSDDKSQATTCNCSIGWKGEQCQCMYILYFPLIFLPWTILLSVFKIRFRAGEILLTRGNDCGSGLFDLNIQEIHGH